MLPVLLALGTAVSFGISDFLTGLAGRRLSLSRTMMLSQGTGTALTLAFGLSLGGRPTPGDCFWGSVAGVVLLGGLAMMLIALRDGRMSEVAPVMAVTGVSVPVLFSLCVGRRFDVPVYGGIALAILAVALINRKAEGQEQPKATPRRARLPLLLGFTSGAAFGLFNILVAQAASTPGIWVLVVANLVRFALLVVVTAFLLLDGGQKSPSQDRRGGPLMAVAAGATVTLAMVLFQLGLHRGGNVAVMTAIGSQASIVTVACAFLVLKEAIGRVQAGALAAAVLSIALIALGTAPGARG